MLKWITEFKASENRALFILLTTTAIVLFNPLLVSTDFGQLLLQVILSLVIISGIYVDAFHKRKSFYITLGLGTILILFEWLDIAHSPEHPLFLLRGVCLALYLLYITIRLIWVILSHEKITPNSIYASITVYLLTGIVGAMWSALAESIQPGSFSMSVEQDFGFQNFIYYSFVTLSTLGYGDISPVSGLAKSIAIALSSVGQLYLAILVAIIVGKYINASSPRA